jgi:hypothetical protein
MDRRLFTLSTLSASILGLTACGGSNDGAALPPLPAPDPDPLPPSTLGPELAVLSSFASATVFLQTRPALDNDREVAPGQANMWDLKRDFSLEDGYNDQWDTAMEMSIRGEDGVEFPFPRDQTYAELSSYGPLLNAMDGVKVVTFGASRATLHSVKGARLQQTLHLDNAVAPVTVSWTDEHSVGPASFEDQPFLFQVVVRDLSGNLLSTLYRDGIDGIAGTGGSGNLSAFVGQQVVLSFELDNARHQPAWISSVSVVDANNTEFVSNGMFASGGSGWTVPDLSTVQNVRSGVRRLGAVDVQRMFFTQPNALWARYADTFTNTSSAPVAISVAYRVNLGSDRAGVIYEPPGSDGRALTSWDGRARDRDIGLVFGNAERVLYNSSTALNTADGNDQIYITFNLSIAPGATKTLINFVLMSGIKTGQTASDATARATEIDGEAARIASVFRTELAFQRGLMQIHLDTAQNF